MQKPFLRHRAPCGKELCLTVVFTLVHFKYFKCMVNIKMYLQII